MKLLVPWLVTTVAVVAAALFFIANHSKTEELAKVQPQLHELEGLRKENSELKASQLSTDELERIRKNTEELVRLRNEVRQLRETEKRLTQQVQAEKAVSQRAQEQAAAARNQAQAAQTEMQAQLQALVTQTNAPPLLTPDQQAFAARYGVAPIPVGQQATACINNLRQLDGAKQQWALENRKPGSTAPTAQDILPYLKDNILPRCPAGGAYSINTVAAHATCSTPGHVLPE